MIMKSDLEIKKGVEHELRWDTGIEHPDIKVKVKNGQVTLTGTVNAYPLKVEAERASLRVNGVIWVNNNIEVRIENKRTDSEIEKAVINAIRWNTSIKDDEIRVQVTDGWVTLEGEVEYEYQKTKARNLTEDISGVVGITNLIHVMSEFVTKR